MQNQTVIVGRRVFAFTRTNDEVWFQFNSTAVFLKGFKKSPLYAGSVVYVGE